MHAMDTDNAHHAKLEAFLDWMQAPESLRKAHRIWNGMEAVEWAALNTETLEIWSQKTQTKRHQISGQTDLVTQLIHFVG